MKKQEKDKTKELEENEELKIKELKNSEYPEQEEGLEEQIEDIGESMNDVQFQEFLKPSAESFSPVLERIARDFPQPVFVDTGSQNVFDEGKKQDDLFKYNAGGEIPKDEPKYQEMSHRGTDPARVEMEKLGREISLFPKPEVQFSHSPESVVSDNRNYEKYDSPKRVDTRELGKGEIIKKKEVKYKPLNQ